MNDLGLKWGRHILVLNFTGFCLASVVFAYIDEVMLGSLGATAPVALAGGVGLAGLVIFGKTLWPAVVVGQIGGALLHGAGFANLEWLPQALGNSAGVIGAAVIVLRLHLPAKPDNLAAMLRYIVFGAGVAAVTSTTVGILIRVSFGHPLVFAAPATVISGLFTSFAWTLIVGSLVQSFWSEGRQPLPHGLLFPMLAAAAAGATLLYLGPASSQYIWCLLPFLLWAGIVGKVRGATASLMLVALPALLHSLGADLHLPGVVWTGFPVFLFVGAPTTLLLAALNMESSLHRHSQRSLALGNAHGGRFEYYPSSHRLKVDPDVKELLEIFSDTSVIREDAIASRIHEDDRAGFRAFLQDLNAGLSSEPCHVQFRVSSLNGDALWLAADGVSVTQTAGSRRVYGVIRDISQQKDSEKKLLDSDRFLKSLIGNLVTFVAVLTPDGTVIETNRPYMRNAGSVAGDVIGKKVWECYWWHYSEDAQTILNAAVSDARAGDTTVYDLQMLDVGGTLTWMEVLVAPLRDDNDEITHLIISGGDLTERLEAEARAHQMAQIIEATPDFVGIADADGKFLYVSPGGLSLMDVPAEEDFLRKHIASVHPEDYVEVLTEEALPAARKSGVWEGQTHLLMGDGGRRPVSQVILGHFDPQGELQQISTVMRDMTEQKRAEEQQLILLRELAHRVKNTLAIIQGFTRQTLRAHPDPADFSRVFQGRVASLATSHSLLTEGEWNGASLRNILQMQLSPSMPDSPDGIDRLSLNGPDVTLPPETAIAFGLVLHELATNAAQHGGWANPDGKVSVEWALADNLLDVAWTESRVAQTDIDSAPKGFGSTLLEMTASSVQRRQDADTYLLTFQLLLFASQDGDASKQ